jgi:uncharacterized protein DUF3870
MTAPAPTRGWAECDTAPMADGTAGSVIVVGYAKVPTTAAARAAHEFFSVSLRVDPASGLVTQVDSTAMTGLVRDWLTELLLGVDLGQSVAPILAEIEANYLGQGAGSIKQAVADAWRRYAAYRSR